MRPTFNPHKAETARRILIDKLSKLHSNPTTVEVGTSYEKHSLRYLNSTLHMSLRWVGGSGDEGIDLRGWWWVPASARRTKRQEVEAKRRKEERSTTADAPVLDPALKEEWLGGFTQEGDDDIASSEVPGARRLRVVAQCKAEKNALNGRAVRELEGVLAHIHGRAMMPGPHRYNKAGKPLEPDPPDSVGVLLSQSGFSQLALVRAWRSPSPLILLHIPGGRPKDEPEEVINVSGAWWNPSLAGPKGLLGGHMEFRREILDGPMSDGQVKATYRVYHEDKRMERLAPAEEDLNLE